MCSASTYYFNSNQTTEGSADVMLAVNFAYFKHFGSLALGSFIIAVIEFIRIVFYYIAERAIEASGENPLVKCIVRCAECLLKCIEKIVDYINTCAYAYMAVSGENFCTSAWNGFLLNMTYGLEFAWANSLAGGFIFLSKMFIVIINCATFIALQRAFKPEVEFIGGAILITALITFFTSMIFLGLMDEVVVGLLTSHAIDKGMNDGEAKFGPPTFHDKVATKIPTAPSKGRKDDYEKI